MPSSTSSSPTYSSFKRLCHEDLVVKDTDRPAPTHAPNQVVCRIVVGADVLGHFPRRRSIHAGGLNHPQGFMRSIGVELFPKRIKLPLLSFQATRRRNRGLLLECSVHPLMDPVLLWLAWLDQLRAHPIFDAHHLQRRQPPQRARGKRHSVVGADPIGQSILTEKPQKEGNCLLHRDRWVCLAAQQETRIQITDRQREAVLPILQSELPFVVGRPDVVGSSGRMLGAPRMRPTVPSLGFHQSLAIQECALPSTPPAIQQIGVACAVSPRASSGPSTDAFFAAQPDPRLSVCRSAKDSCAVGDCAPPDPSDPRP